MGFFGKLMFWKKKEADLGFKGLDVPGVGAGGLGGLGLTGSPPLGADIAHGTPGFGAGPMPTGFPEQGITVPSAQGAMPGMYGHDISGTIPEAGAPVGFDASHSFGVLRPQVPGQPASMQGSGVISQGIPGRKDFYEVPQQQQQSLQMQQPQAYSDAQFQAQVQVINAKMDAIRAMLESINQRLANIERIAYESQGQSSQGSQPRRPMW